MRPRYAGAGDENPPYSVPARDSALSLDDSVLLRKVVSTSASNTRNTGVVVPRSDGGVLRSGVVFVRRRLRHRTLRRIPALLRRRRRVVGWEDVLLGRDRCGVEGTQRAVGWMSGDHDRCFSTLVPEAF